MANYTGWRCGKGWEFPYSHLGVVTGAVLSRPPFMVAFRQVATRKQMDALIAAVEDMTDDEKQLCSALSENERRIHVWTRAGLPLSELVLQRIGELRLGA